MSNNRKSNNQFFTIVNSLQPPPKEKTLFVWHCLLKEHRIDKLTDSEIEEFLVELVRNTDELKKIQLDNKDNYEEELRKVAKKLRNLDEALNLLSFVSSEALPNSPPSQEVIISLQKAIENYHQALFPLAVDVQDLANNRNAPNEIWSVELIPYANHIEALRTIQNNLQYQLSKPEVKALVQKTQEYAKSRENTKENNTKKNQKETTKRNNGKNKFKQLLKRRAHNDRHNKDRGFIGRLFRRKGRDRTD